MKTGQTLGRQLVAGVLTVLVSSVVLLAGVTVYSLTSLDHVNRELVEIMHSSETVSGLQLALLQTGAPLGAYLLGRDQRNRERFEALIRSAEDKLQSCASSACHGSVKMPERMVAAVRPAIERLKADGRRVFEEGPAAGAADVEAVRRSIAGMRQALVPMLAAIGGRSDQLIREAQVVRRRVWALTISLTAFTALAGCLAASVIARRISRPLSDLVLGIRRVMAGDWSYQATAEGAAEISELASSFNRMVHEVRQHRERLEEQNRTLEERVRRRTEELRQREQALAQAEKLASLGLLAAGVAHELNNPLTSIMMNANLMMEEVGEGTTLYKELKRIDTDASRCRRIVEDLRVFARVRQIEKVSTGVDSMIEQAVSLAAQELALRGAKVRYDLAPDLPEIALDPGRMVQVLTNLLVNAAQAIGQGGSVVVRARCELGWLTIEVQDDGIGIPATHRDGIFDPFFTTKPEGTGLGLSISYGIVKEHGGRIEVESRTRGDVDAGDETGTTMRIMLPIGEMLE